MTQSAQMQQEPGPARSVPAAEIVPSRWQPRRQFDPDGLRELALSIREHGLINPVVGFRNESGKVELIAGERRFRAILAVAIAATVRGGNLSGAAGLVAEDWKNAVKVLAGHKDAMPAVAVLLRDGDPESFHEIGLIDNLQREDITAIEEAEAFDRLMRDRGWTQSRLAAVLGKGPAYVSQRLTLLDLAEPIKAEAAGGEVSFSVARAISSVPAPVQVTVKELAEAAKEPGEELTARAVGALAGKVRRFLDLDNWAPVEPVEPKVRNRFRVLRYHLRQAAADPERVAAMIRDLGTGDAWSVPMIGKRPAAFADTDYMTIKVLQAATGIEVDPAANSDLAPWWADLAKLRGDRSCAACQFRDLADLDLQVEGAPAGFQWACPRMAGADVGTCPGWLGHEDPIWIRGGWDIRDALAGDRDSLVGGAANCGIRIVRADREFFFDDLGEYGRAVVLALEYHVTKAARAEVSHRDRWIGQIAAYWQAQAEQAEAETGIRWALTSCQAHTCRRCMEWDPDLDPPCRYTVDPLPDWYDRTKGRAPMFAAMLSNSGVIVPRCERFRVVEVPTIDPVQGVRFPEDPDGRAEVLTWLTAIMDGDHGRNHEGAIMGPLAWLPYDRTKRQAWDSARAAAWILDHWRECGGDRGVARLLSVAVSEVEARGQYPPFDLIDPMLGEIETWISVPWSVLEEGRRLSPGTYGIGEEWDQPWVRDLAPVDLGDLQLQPAEAVADG